MVVKKYNIDSLKDDSIKFLYQLRLANKIKELTIQQDAEDSYEQLKKIIYEAASEALGVVERHSKTNYWDNVRIQEMIKEKRKVYHNG